MVKHRDIGRGVWIFTHYRGGKILSRQKIENATTVVGRNYLLSAGLGGGAQITTWFCGLVDNAAFTGASTADTMASHAGWVEFTGYGETVRQTWPPDAPFGAQIQNSTTEMTFTVNAVGVVVGCFLTSSNTKGGTSGTLWNFAALTSGPLNVLVGDVLQASYAYGIGTP